MGSYFLLRVVYRVTGSYDVRFRGEICGRLDVQKRGVLTEFSCDCDCVEKERVVRLVCGGKTVGVCVPENGRLCLTKRFSDAAMRDMGLTGAEDSRLVPDGEEEGEAWTEALSPGSLFTDGETARACEGIRGALVSKRDGAVLLAVPCSEEPFPLMPLFRFGRPYEIEGRPYLVFGIRNGEIFM